MKKLFTNVTIYNKGEVGFVMSYLETKYISLSEPVGPIKHSALYDIKATRNTYFIHISCNLEPVVKVIKLCPCSTQLSMKFYMLMKSKLLIRTVVF